jgi:hypothetical protein
MLKTKGKRTYIIASLISFLLLVFLASPVRLAALEEIDRKGLEVIENSIKKTVAETGTEVIGQGSWITKTKYKGPLSGGTSDHDMRIILSDELDQEELIEKWTKTQESLKNNIKSIGKANNLSDDQIKKLLDNTNVYPPNQLMTGIENEKDAIEAFKKYKAKPNLGGKNVEGLFGEGSTAFKQYYEEKAGKVFYKDVKTGRVTSGKVDLTHMKEGVAKFTTAGEANNALQWGDKALEELSEGRLAKVQKQVERLKQSLNKAKSLERFGSKTGYLDDIISGKITDFKEIEILIEKAKTEAGLIKSLSKETNSIKRELMKDLLDEGSGKFSKFRGIFWNHIGKVPVDRLIQGLSVYMNYAHLRNIASQATVTDTEFRAEINKVIVKELGFYASGIIPGLAMEITDAVLTSIREGVYEIVTLFQDCEDLVTGIHSVKGREDVGKGMTVEQMATTFTDTDLGRRGMMNFIHYQSAQASMRFLDNNWVEDPNIRENLYRKCAPQIVIKWQEIRLKKIDEFNRLFKQLEGMINTNMALIEHEPDADLIPLKEQPGKGQKIATVMVIGSTTKDIGKMEELVKKMNDIVSPLEGRNGDLLFLSSRYEMRIDSGEPIKGTHKPIQRHLTYNRIGEHNIKLDHELELSFLAVSEDIGRYSVLGSYVLKKIPTTATYSFSVVEETRLSAKINVTVKDKMTGNPIPAANVQVSLLPDGLRMPPSVTDIKGITTFGNIPAGQYRISAKAQGYSESGGTLTIDPAKKQEYSGTIWLSALLQGLPKEDAIAKEEREDLTTPKEWRPWEDYKFYSGTVTIKPTKYYIRKVITAGKYFDSKESKESVTCESTGVVRVMLNSRWGDISGLFRITTGTYPAKYEITKPTADGGRTTEEGYKCAPIRIGEIPLRDYVPYATTYEKDYGSPVGVSVGWPNKTRDGKTISEYVGVGIKYDRVILIREGETFPSAVKGLPPFNFPTEKGVPVTGKATPDGRFTLLLNQYSDRYVGDKLFYVPLAEGSYDETKMSGSHIDRINRPLWSDDYYTGLILYNFSLDLKRLTTPKP